MRLLPLRSSSRGTRLLRSHPLRLLLLPLLGLFSLGASCNQGVQEPGTKAAGQDAPAAAATAPTAQIDKLPNVDTSALTDGERRTWTELVNELLSPCGEPVSVAKCVAESRGCNACVPAARYMVRLVSEGMEKGEIQELFADRYDPKRKVNIDTADAPVRGAPMAPITIVEFSDFECPHCGAAHPVLARIIEEFGGKVNLAFKNFPLDGHVHAGPAARAAVAAQHQGKFWQMADALFEHQRELGDEKIRELAKEVGVDMAKFDADLESGVPQTRVENDHKEGLALHIEGTPTLYINGRPYKESVSNLSKYLKEELGQ
jgi:protein-disulfide isomerase